MTASRSDALVLFGVTGDLAHKMIFPALYAMTKRGTLKVPVIGVAFPKWSLTRLRTRVTASIRRSGRIDNQRAFGHHLSLLSFVHVRKPDADIFRLAREIPQASAPQLVYIENTPMFVQVAEGLGIRSVLHTDYRSTCAELASFGLRNDEGVVHETG